MSSGSRSRSSSGSGRSDASREDGRRSSAESSDLAIQGMRPEPSASPTDIESAAPVSTSAVPEEAAEPATTAEETKEADTPHPAEEPAPEAQPTPAAEAGTPAADEPPAAEATTPKAASAQSTPRDKAPTPRQQEATATPREAVPAPPPPSSRPQSARSRPTSATVRVASSPATPRGDASAKQTPRGDTATATVEREGSGVQQPPPVPPLPAVPPLPPPPHLLSSARSSIRQTPRATGTPRSGPPTHRSGAQQTPRGTEDGDSPRGGPPSTTAESTTHDGQGYYGDDVPMPVDGGENPLLPPQEFLDDDALWNAGGGSGDQASPKAAGIGFELPEMVQFATIMAEDVELPSSTLHNDFEAMRTAADKIFSPDDIEEWFSDALQPHVMDLNVQPLQDTDVEAEQQALEADQAAQAKSQRDFEFNYVKEHIKQKLAKEEEEFEFELKRRHAVEREEEVAARERVTYEHQALEDHLLVGVQRKFGLLQANPRSATWGLQWRGAPQYMKVNVTSLRGVRAKLRDGYYVVLLSVLDRVGGMNLQLRSGNKNIPCAAALPPMKMRCRSETVDRFINQSVTVTCPSAALMSTHACLQIEVWALKAGKYDPVDHVVGWGVWPLLDINYNVAEGKFRTPLIRGEVDDTIDTYLQFDHTIEKNLTAWLGTLYFEIALERGPGPTTDPFGESQEMKNDSMRVDVQPEELTEPQVIVSPSSRKGAEGLRFRRTVNDERGLVVPQLPPRLFFDDVRFLRKKKKAIKSKRDTLDPFTVTTNKKVMPGDLREHNAALWEKRALLEDEHELTRIGDESATEFDSEEEERQIRGELSVRRDTRRRTSVLRQFGEFENEEKNRDSHILLYHHKRSISTQREFFFLGRRYRDQLAIAKSVMMYDGGINLRGSWDKGKVAAAVLCLAVSLYVRMYVHCLGNWVFISSKDVPFITNKWTAYGVDIRYDTTRRFQPDETFGAVAIGQTFVIGAWILFALWFSLLVIVFGRMPYVASRLIFWFGVVAVLDPVVQLLTDVIQDDYVSGEAFMLPAQLLREEGSSLIGILITVCIYVAMSFVQVVLTYWFVVYFHLNSRVQDIYKRLLYPEASFSCPYDLEISEEELNEVVNKAKTWRTDAGDIKKLEIQNFDHFYTCLFRERLWKLLSCMKPGQTSCDQWVVNYIDSISLRRPKYAEKLIECDLGRFSLGSDVIDFLRRAYPKMTQIARDRVGDQLEDQYYERELLKSIHNSSMTIEDEKEVRVLLKCYFLAQIMSDPPVHWDEEDPTLFHITDPQLLADLIFFETSYAWRRMYRMGSFLKEFCPEYDEPGAQCRLPKFTKFDRIRSTEGDPAHGSVIRIVMENPGTGMRQRLRTFVVLPFGIIIEPSYSSYTLLAKHTADHPESWAAKAFQADSEFHNAGEMSGVF